MRELLDPTTEAMDALFPRCSPRLSQDATIVLTLARIAVCFAGTRAQEAERWLRLLRMHGRVGSALEELGVSEAPLETASDNPYLRRRPHDCGECERTIEEVSRRAAEFARRSEAATVGTVHLLFAVLSVYGRIFDRELYRHGSSREELFERLPGGAFPGGA